MTEAEWRLAARNVRRMLGYASEHFSNRKVRLYLCGGIRQRPQLLFSHHSVEAIEVVERYLDGLASDDEMGRANWFAEAPTFGSDFDAEFYERYPECRQDLPHLVELGVLSESVLTGGEWQVNQTLRDSLLTSAEIVYRLTYGAYRESDLDTLARFINRLKWPNRALKMCVFGNPFRPVTMDSAWLTSTALSLARGIYNDRAFDRLPILADALQEAGCDNADILKHCRSDELHVRGCWVVDLLVGKV